MKDKDRNSTVEILRLLFMYLIVVIHVFGHGYNVEWDKLFALGLRNDTLAHFIIISLCSIGVPGFIFITGYFGLSFSWKKVMKLYLISCFYELLILSVTHELTLWRVFFQCVYPFENWWFLRDYMLLLVLSPIINTGYDCIDKRSQTIVVGSLMFITYMAYFIYGRHSHNILLFVTIYLFARYIKDRKELFQNLRGNTIFLIFLLILYIGIAVLVAKLGLRWDITFRWLSYNNILVLLICASLVLWADRHPLNISWVNYLASSSLAIYMLTDHELVRNFLDNMLLPTMFQYWGYLLCLLVCFVCLTIDKLREFIFGCIGNMVITFRQHQH